MLSTALVDWWFAPWTYARSNPPDWRLATDWVARRDGYRWWCEHALVTVDLPLHFDPGWEIAAVTSGNQLIATARLFAGLIAAREQNQAVLGELDFAERKWCVSIAATQPLHACRKVDYRAGDAIEVRGLLELARRLELGFPGIWSRCRLMLPAELAERVGSLLQSVLATAENFDSGATRAQRCWRLCRDRAEAGNIAAKTMNL